MSVSYQLADLGESRDPGLGLLVCFDVQLRADMPCLETVSFVPSKDVYQAPLRLHRCVLFGQCLG